jgi:hypothetical protein
MIAATAHQRRPLTLRLMGTRRNERGWGFFKSGSMALYQRAPQPQRGFSPAANGRDKPESPDHRRPSGCGILLRAKPYQGMGWRRMHRGGPSEVHRAARSWQNRPETGRDAFDLSNVGPRARYVQ